MKKSLITGFPELVETKSTARRYIKLFVFLICTAGFIYQTYSFVDLYFSYPTIVNSEDVLSDTVQAPAVTICNHNRLSRRRYCLAHPNYCLTVKNIEVFCNVYPKFCPSSNDTEIFNHLVNENYVYYSQNTDEVLNKFGPERSNELIKSCEIRGPNKRLQCENVVPVRVLKNGYPYRCFAVQSLWGKPDEVPRNLSMHDSYVIELNVHPEDYIDHNGLMTAQVHIHHPRIMANPWYEGISLKSGFDYSIQVNLERRKSLPAPYKTNCTDYMSMWEKNGGYGPLIMKQCQDKCKIKYFMAYYGCIPITTTFNNEFPVCDKTGLVPSSELNMRCSSECGDACKMDYYTLSSVIENKLSVRRCKSDDIHCQNSMLRFVMKVRQFTVTNFNHEPKFQSIEFFSYVGGYMGMWLGISFVSLFDFAEMMFDIGIYPIEKTLEEKKARKMENDKQMRSRTCII